VTFPQRTSFFFLVLICSCSFCSFAQLPDTDIWLLDVRDSLGGIALKNPVNFTNRDGYDNQPAFSPDGRYILFTSIREGTQSDIYKYELSSGKTSRFTFTPESEYSPTFMPDGKSISVVRVEQDSTQRLWKFPIEGGEPSLVLKSIKNIGYHYWINPNTLALFLLPSPFSLVVARLNTGQTIQVDDSIGRCIQSTGSENQWTYLKKTSDSTGRICRMDGSDRLAWKMPALKKSEDYAWLDDSSALMAKGSCIYKVSYPNQTQLIADLSKSGIYKIGRLVLSKDKKKLALVTTK